jgi:DNA-damage-inducible protein J
MTVEAVAHATVEQEIIDKASAIYAAAGMTVDEAFSLLLERTVEEQSVPFTAFRPNQETIDAMMESRQGTLKKFSSLEDLMADLHADD